MKTIFLAAVALLFIGFGCTPTEQVKTVTNPVVENPIVAPVVEVVEPLSYSIVGIPVSVSKDSEPFEYTSDNLRAEAEGCGFQHEEGYFDELVTKFSGVTKTIYNFKYTNDSQEPSVYIVTLVPNKPGYTSLEQFKQDFSVCAAGGKAYPKMLDSDWLLFVSSCGSGYSDGSGKPIGCDEVRKVVEPTLKLGVEEKAWRLSFDLPEGWVMTDGCELQGKTVYCVRNLTDNYSRESVPELDLDIDPQADVIYLQNSKKIALFGGVAPNDTVKDLFQSENIVQIKVSTLDKAEIVPPTDSVKNEDLGNGFYKVTTCDIVTTPECEIYGQSSFEYYFVAASGNKYRFSFISQDVPESVIQAVVLSAKE